MDFSFCFVDQPNCRDRLGPLNGGNSFWHCKYHREQSTGLATNVESFSGLADSSKVYLQRRRRKNMFHYDLVKCARRTIDDLFLSHLERAKLDKRAEPIVTDDLNWWAFSGLPLFLGLLFSFALFLLLLFFIFFFFFWAGGCGLFGFNGSISRCIRVVAYIPIVPIVSLSSAPPPPYITQSYVLKERTKIS